MKKKLKKDKFKYDCVIIFNGYQIDYSTLTKLKKASKSFINIQTDNIFEKKTSS